MDQKRPRRRRLSASASRPLELGRRSVPERAATVQTDLWTRLAAPAASLSYQACQIVEIGPMA